MPPDRLKPLHDEAVFRLKEAGCDTPALDARLLLESATGLTRETLILDPAREVGTAEAERFRELIRRRADREPVSRIIGAREFYGRRFRVTPAVLDPRPDTETLVEAALKRMPPSARVLDLGTGSGAIIVTLLAERSDATGLATDISSEALAVARENAAALGVAERLAFLEAPWFDGIGERFDLVVSNPPYIPRADIAALSADVRNFDPLLALVGGSDGLDPYRAIAAGAAARLKPGGSVAVEIGAGQADSVEGIFAASGFRQLGRHRDLGGHIRCLEFGL